MLAQSRLASDIAIPQKIERFRLDRKSQETNFQNKKKAFFSKYGISSETSHQKKIEHFPKSKIERSILVWTVKKTRQNSCVFQTVFSVSARYDKIEQKWVRFFFEYAHVSKKLDQFLMTPKKRIAVFFPDCCCLMNVLLWLTTARNVKTWAQLSDFSFEIYIQQVQWTNLR